MKKARKKREIYQNFDTLRKEVLNLIPNFTKLNELPAFKETNIENTSSDFISEEVYIKDLDYFYTNCNFKSLKNNE